jgi:hypothetical protein
VTSTGEIRVRSIARLEEAPGYLGVPARLEEDVDDLAELVDGPEQIVPDPSEGGNR